ncbi:MAG: twin-arginine translocase TatA/TatE family subunit [Aquificae bacterium]|nr:twin-arginine translocase TatA/TatE family subunit [Aquificota bacterium]
MLPGGISTTELIIILAVVFILFGASRLPEAGRALGEGIRNFRKALAGETEQEQQPKKLEPPKTEAVQAEEKSEEVKEAKEV